MERLSDKNPCNDCTVDRQIGNPYRHQCECDRCLKPGRWKGECVKKLKEYEEMFPCKVGDTVYFLKNKEILMDYVVQIHIAQLWKQTIFSCYADCFSVEQLGKTVFLTHQEAEDKLAEMEV